MHAMQAGLRQSLKEAVGFAGVAAGVLILDQATKAWVLGSLWPPESEKFTLVVPGLLRFQAARNTGAAFSLFQEHPGVLTLIASMLALCVLGWRFLLPPKAMGERFALAMIFGGAVGNLVDRFRFGYVVDFIVAHWRDHAWPTFNLADSAICVGIGVFLISSWIAARSAHCAEASE